MPVISAGNLSTLRTTRHATQMRLVVDVPPTIWSAQVNGTQTQGDTTITVKNVVQVRAPVWEFSVLFGTTAGARDLGETHFISYAALTLTVGGHNSTLPDNAYITILEDIAPRAILPVLDANDIPSEDGVIAYTDENDKYVPLARIGFPAIAESVSGTATVKFYAQPVAIAALATITAHSWDVVDGVVTAGATNIANTAALPLTVTYATSGRRYIAYTCTDSNGKTHTRHNPIWIDPSYYSAIEISGIEGDRSANCWRCSVKVMTNADETAFPPRAMIVLYSKDYFDDTRQDIGGQWTFRENIKLVGYIRKGTVKANPLAGYVEFEVEGIGGVAAGLYAPAYSLESNNAPTDWHMLKGLTPNLAAHHILTQHSTLSAIADCYLGMLDYTQSFFDMTEGTVNSQLTALCDGGCTRNFWGSTAQGAIRLSANPQLQAVADRPATVILSTTLADLRDEVDIGDQESEHKIAQIDLASDDGASDAYFSLAPATPFADSASGIQKVDDARADSQVESNELAGNLLAYANSSYKTITINWRGNYCLFDPFVVEAIQLSIPAAANRRGLVWVNEKCWTSRVSYDYRAGILLVSSVVELDVSGSDGITNTVPDIPAPVVAPPTTPPWVYPPPIPPTLPPTVYGQTALIYNIGDGYNNTIAAGETVKLLCITSGEQFKVRGVTGYCTALDVTVNVYFNVNAPPSGKT